MVVFEWSLYVVEIGWEIFVNCDEEIGLLSILMYFCDVVLWYDFGLFYELMFVDGMMVD